MWILQGSAISMTEIGGGHKSGFRDATVYKFWKLGENLEGSRNSIFVVYICKMHLEKENI